MSCNILDKWKGNLSQKYVKKGVLSFQDKIGTTAPDFPREMTVFPVLSLLSHPSLPKLKRSALIQKLSLQFFAVIIGVFKVVDSSDYFRKHGLILSEVF